MNTSDTINAGGLAWTPAHEHLLAVRQVEELYRQGYTAAWFALFGAMLTLGVFHDTRDLAPGLYWIAFATAVAGYRIGLARNFLASPDTTHDPHKWARLAIAGNFLAGVQWGLLGTFLFPSEPGYREIFSIMVITCFVGGSVTAYASVKWAHPALAIPATLPATFYLFFLRDGVHLYAGVVALFFCFAIIYYSQVAHRGITRRMRLEIAHEELASQSRERQLQLIKSNRALEHRSAVRYKTARQAQDRANLLAAHFQDSPLPMFNCDRHLRLLEWNQAANNRFGELLKGQQGQSLVATLAEPGQATELMNAVINALARKAPASLPCSLKQADGGIQPMILHLTPILPRDGQPGQVAVIAAPVSSQGQVREVA